MSDNLLKYLKNCQILSEFVRICQNLSEFVRFYQILSEIVRHYQKLSEIVRNYQKLSETDYSENYQNLSGSPGEMLSDYGKRIIRLRENLLSESGKSC